MVIIKQGVLRLNLNQACFALVAPDLIPGRRLDQGKNIIAFHSHYVYYLYDKYYKLFKKFVIPTIGMHRIQFSFKGAVMGRQAITVSLPEELGEKLKAYCSHSERPKSWLVQKALEDYFDNMQDLEIALARKLDPTDEEITLKEVRRELGLSD